MRTGLVGGEAFSIDASLIKADVDKKKRMPGDQPIAWPKIEEASHAVREYLAALDTARGDEDGSGDAGGSGTASRSYRAAWVSGLLLELAYAARRNNQAELADRILIECHNLESAAEGHLMAYLMEGFKEVRQMPLDPLIDWK